VNGIIIEGDASRVLATLRRIKNSMLVWEAVGYERFHPEEDWIFETKSGRSCPRCLSLNGRVYPGDEVARIFPNHVPMSPTEVSARLHRNCGCRLRWINIKEMLQSRLHRESSVVR